MHNKPDTVQCCNQPTVLISSPPIPAMPPAFLWPGSPNFPFSGPKRQPPALSSLFLLAAFADSGQFFCQFFLLFDIGFPVHHYPLCLWRPCAMHGLGQCRTAGHVLDEAGHADTVLRTGVLIAPEI